MDLGITNILPSVAAYYQTPERLTAVLKAIKIVMSEDRWLGHFYDGGTFKIDTLAKDVLLEIGDIRIALHPTHAALIRLIRELSYAELESRTLEAEEAELNRFLGEDKNEDEIY